MKNTLLLCCLLVAALFTSCLEEDTGLGEMESVRELVNYEAVVNGTGLPRVVELRNAIYTNTKTGESQEKSLGHIQISFFPCGYDWCRSRTDDCGASGSLEYLYKDTNDGETIAFRDFTYIPVFKDWAEEANFHYNRDGADLKFDCVDCDGETSDGFAYTDRRVILRVIE